MAQRKPSRPQIILLLFQGLFIISALLHTIPLLLDILPTVISVLACTLFSCFLLLSSLRSLLLPISCQASPWRITKGIGNNQTTLPSPKNRPEFFIINHLLPSLLQLKKKSQIQIIFRHGSRFLFRISQFKIIYLNTALCECAFCGPELFSTWATVKSY